MSGVSDLIVIEDSDDEQPVAKQPSTRSAPTSTKTTRSLRPPSKSSATQNTPTPPTAAAATSLTTGATSPFTEPSMPTTPSFNSETELAQLQPAPVTPRANGSALPSLDAEPEHPQIAGHHDYDEELSDIEDLMELDPSLVEEDEGDAEPEQVEGEEGDESDSQSEGDSEESGDEEDISQSPRAVAAALAVEGEPTSAPVVTVGDASTSASGEPSATAVPDSGAAAATVSADGTTPMDTTTDGKPVNILKPKVKRPHKAPTPPPAPPPPMQTVRITIPIEPFAGRDRERNYEFDIVELAAAKGINMRPAVPVVRIDDESEDEKDEKDEKGNNSAEEIAKRFEAMAAEEDAGKKRRKSRKRKYEEEQYDLHDGWIDDTELAAQERKFVAETKQKGYYVSLGEVALKTLGPPPGTKSPGKPGPKPRIPVPVVPPPPPQTHPADIPLSDRPQNKRSALARTLHALPGKIEARHSRAMKLHLTTALDLPPANESGKIVVKGYEVDAPGSPSKDSSGNSDQPIAVDDDEDTPGRASHSPRASTKPISTASAPGGGPSHSPVSATEPSGRGTKRKATTLSASTASALANSAAADGEDLMGEPTRKRRRGATMATLDFVHPSFTTDLVGELEVLKEVVEREAKAFGVKGKFPQHVKPLLGQIAMRAVVRDEYDDPFFDAMPKIFPYNRFTMKKLVARTVFQSHTDLLNQRNEELLADLKKITDDGFEKAKEDQKAAIEAWEAKQAKKKAVDAGGAAAADGTPVPVDLAASTQTAADKEKEDKPPQQKYRMNEVIRNIIWDLVCLSNDIVTLANEKSKYENSSDTTSEQSQRKILYQKIQAAFPDGWMNSSILSREVSLLKRKQGEQNMADAAKTTT